MGVVSRCVSVLRELRPIFYVAVGVTIVGTVTGSVLDHQHQVAAEALVNKEVVAVPSNGGQQTLAFKEWGVQVSLPLAVEMPLLRYAGGSNQSIGLSSANLVKFGSQCSASNNALGTLLRYPAGTYSTSVKPSWGANSVGTVGAYDYVYLFPQNSCVDNEAARVIVNTEESVLLDAFGNLSPLTP
jgi:hypothetical protein